MPQIDIDFEVFKKLTGLREAESVTYNDVIRDLLKMPRFSGKPTQRASNGARPWIVSDTSFPAGSEFLAEYKGQTYTGVTKDGKLEVNGRLFSTPSAAAVSITTSNVNGWRFWKCRLPGATKFELIERLRGKSN